jgi:hypothetical protein
MAYTAKRQGNAGTCRNQGMKEMQEDAKRRDAEKLCTYECCSAPSQFSEIHHSRQDTEVVEGPQYLYQSQVGERHLC